MKVDSATSQKMAQAPKQNDNDELRKKLAEKFGKDVIGEAQKKQEAAEISKKAKNMAEGDGKIIDKADAVIGDVNKNDPADSITQDKLKQVLRTGAFNFNEKERNALQEILGA